MPTPETAVLRNQRALSSPRSLASRARKAHGRPWEAASRKFRANSMGLKMKSIGLVCLAPMLLFGSSSLALAQQRPVLEQPPQIDACWAHAMGGALPNADRIDNLGQGIAVDATGTVHITGAFRGSGPNNLRADFDQTTTYPDDRDILFNTYSNNVSDVFIVKRGFSGNFLWARSLGGDNDDAGEDIAVDPDGNVYVTGLFRDTVLIRRGPGRFDLPIFLISEGSADAFVAKLDPDGQFLWARAFGARGLDAARAISVDDAGNVYVAGVFAHEVDFDRTASYPDHRDLLNSAGRQDTFLLKFDRNGTFLWARAIGSGVDIAVNSDGGLGVAADLSGDVYATGYFAGPADFDRQNIRPDGEDILTSEAGHDTFVVKFNANGGFVWARAIGGISEVAFLSDAGRDIALDANGNAYITGQYLGEADFDRTATHSNDADIMQGFGGPDVFVVKFDADGNFLWVRGLGSDNDDYGFGIAPQGSRVYTTGSFQGLVDFDPGPGTTELDGDESDIFIWELNAGGGFVSASRMGGQSFDRGTNLSVHVRALGPRARARWIFTTGFFAGSADFDPGPQTLIVNAAGGSTTENAFVSCARYGGRFPLPVPDPGRR